MKNPHWQRSSRILAPSHEICFVLAGPRKPIYLLRRRAYSIESTASAASWCEIHWGAWWTSFRWGFVSTNPLKGGSPLKFIDINQKRKPQTELPAVAVIPSLLRPKRSMTRKWPPPAHRTDLLLCLPLHWSEASMFAYTRFTAAMMPAFLHLRCQVFPFSEIYACSMQASSSLEAQWKRKRKVA